MKALIRNLLGYQLLSSPWMNSLMISTTIIQTNQDRYPRSLSKNPPFNFSLTCNITDLHRLQPLLFQIKSTKPIANSFLNRDRTPAETEHCISYSFLTPYCKFTLLLTLSIYKSTRKGPCRPGCIQNIQNSSIYVYKSPRRKTSRST